MIPRPVLYEPTACAGHPLGCTGRGLPAVVDPHADLVDDLPAEAERIGAPIVAVLATHARADHVFGPPDLVGATGARPYLPAGAAVDFAHHALCDGERIDLANTVLTTLMTPGHAPAHAAHPVADRRRGTHPSHFGGSVCERAPSGAPISTIGLGRRHHEALAHADADAFAAALVRDPPPPPAGQAQIVARNRQGRAAATG